MSNKIPDFTESEIPVVATALKQRCGEEVELQFANAEIQIKQIKQINKDNNEKVDCPVLFWRHQGASLIVSKMGEKRFSARYFYTPSRTNSLC